MKTLLLTIYLLIAGIKIFAQVEPANNDQKLKDSSMQKGDRILVSPDPVSLIDLSVKTPNEYFIKTTDITIDSLALGLESINKRMVVGLWGEKSFILSIGVRDQLTFMFTDNDKFTVRSVQKNQAGYGSAGDAFSHGYNILITEIKRLTNKSLKTIRISKGNSYSTLNISQSNAERLRQIANAFLKEYDNKVLKK